MEIRIYFEGNKALRSGFEVFFGELETAARKARSTLEFIAARDGLSDYRKAGRTHPHAWNILLKDSEEPVPARPADLCARRGIDPQHVADVFWMVELMEAWFLAHPKTLSDYYGGGFLSNTIGNNADVERVPKTEVLSRLKRATRNTSKGEYHKVKHAPFLLEKLDSGRVQERAAHCRELFDAVMAKLNEVES
jgi:Domain of unknown function (DUF4276)